MKKLLVIVLAIAVIYFASIAFLAFSKGYSIAHMDWNNDGDTTVLEMIRAKDIGVKVLDEKCLEFYQLKDGLPVKSVCD